MQALKQDEARLFRLKRSLKFRSSMNFQTINRGRLFVALQWLKENNTYYANVNVCEPEQWTEQNKANDKEGVLESLVFDDENVVKEYRGLLNLDKEPDTEEGDGREDMQGRQK